LTEVKVVDLAVADLTESQPFTGARKYFTSAGMFIPWKALASLLVILAVYATSITLKTTKYAGFVDEGGSHKRMLGRGSRRVGRHGTGIGDSDNDDDEYSDSSGADDDDDDYDDDDDEVGDGDDDEEYPRDAQRATSRGVDLNLGGMSSEMENLGRTRGELVQICLDDGKPRLHADSHAHKQSPTCDVGGDHSPMQWNASPEPAKRDMSPEPHVPRSSFACDDRTWRRRSRD
jgi:hypothetical protein